MNPYTTALANRGDKSLVVDTNLFLLFLVGSYSSRAIPSFKRTSHYSRADFKSLVRIIDSFLPHSRVLTTPHVLTEVSNLAGQASGRLRAAIFQVFARLIPQIREETSPGADLARQPEFSKFGITDCAILGLDPSSSIVLTDDLGLAAKLESLGRPVISFGHIRAERKRRS